MNRALAPAGQRVSRPRIGRLAGYSGLALVLVLGFVAFLPVLGHWFEADDFWFLRHARDTGWGEWLRRSWDFRHAGPVPEFGEYRPLYLIAFKGEYSLFGLHAFPYHLTNVISHLLTAAVLWAIALRLTRNRAAATLAGGIFALNPAYASAVEWVSNGNAIMATLFYLLAFLLFLDCCESERWGVAPYAGFLACLVAALMLHPVTAPLAAVLPLALFLTGRRSPLQPKAWLPLLPVVAIYVPYYVIQAWVRDHSGGPLAAAQLGPHVYDHFRYLLGLSVYPTGMGSDHLRLAGVATVGACLVVLASWRRFRPAPLVVAWYLTSLLPASLLILDPLPRLLYLPGAPLALMLSVLALQAAEVSTALIPRLTGGRRLSGAWSLALIVAGLAVLAGNMQGLAKDADPYGPGQRRQDELNRQFLTRLGGEYRSLPAGGTLYVVGPPLNLILFNDWALASLVRLYYGDVETKTVPLREPPHWDEAQARASLGPDDRVFVFQR